MSSVVLYHTDEVNNATEEKISSLQGAGHQVILINQDSISSVSEAFYAAIDQATDENVILVNDSRTITAEDINGFAKHESTSGCQYATILYSHLSELSVDNLVHHILSYHEYPLTITGVKKSVINDMETISASSFESIVAQAIIGHVAHHEELTPVSTEAHWERTLFNDQETAEILSFVINSCNIEELFPEHSWKEFEAESAAAAYHTLAAGFIRLGDHETAKQCLSFSDKLEDSPRSLALKAMISLKKGETLGAVANMVTCLQQYEARKSDQEKEHYLTFNPLDIEKVNTSLNAGLGALNQRDNETAYNLFADAVFNFDSFYVKNGLAEHN